MVSQDSSYFPTQTENSREPSSFPSGPASFRATYLPVSGCLSVSVKRRTIYFPQITVCLGSLFIYYLFCSNWSFILLTYTNCCLRMLLCLRRRPSVHMLCPDLTNNFLLFTNYRFCYTVHNIFYWYFFMFALVNDKKYKKWLGQECSFMFDFVY